MTSFKKYFLYRFKSNYLRLTIITAIAVIVMMLCRNSYDYHEAEKLVLINIVTNWLCFVMPMLEMSGLKNRRNMDTILSLPVSRTKTALAHLLNGYIQIAIPLTVCTVIYLVLLNSPEAENYPWQVLLNYVVLLPMSALIYGLYSFIFMQANSVVDGVITQTMSVFAISTLLEGVMMACINVVGTGDYDGINSFLLFSPVDIVGEMLFSPDAKIEKIEIVATVILAVMGMAAIWGCFKSFNKIKTEKIGGISDSIIGYKTLIPLYAFSLSAANWGWFILLAAFIGYAIFRRGVKFTKGDIVCLVVTLALQLIFNNI